MLLINKAIVFKSSPENDKVIKKIQKMRFFFTHPLVREQVPTVECKRIKERACTMSKKSCPFLYRKQIYEMIELLGHTVMNLYIYI